MVAWFGVLDISFPCSSLDQIKDANSTSRLDRITGSQLLVFFNVVVACLFLLCVSGWIRSDCSTLLLLLIGGGEPFGHGGLSFLRGYVSGVHQETWMEVGSIFKNSKREMEVLF